MDALLSPKRRTLLQALGAAAVVAGCGERSVTLATTRPVFAFSGASMGTTYNVRIAGAALAPEREAAVRHAVESSLEGVVTRMSTYDPASELSRFNAHASTTAFALSAATLDVFETAARVSAETNGAFDVTVAPWVNVWGFGPSKDQKVPSSDVLRALQPGVGYRQIAVQRDRGTATKAQPMVTADLSGVAKGYAVDVAARALEGLGIADYMIEAGGEVRTRGRNATNQPWQIGIERPDAMPQQAHFIAPLSGQSMATSGDYRIYFERDGRRYSHEIDPATGAPVTHGLASVSVVAADCVYADAMATALFVLGPERGYALADAQQLAAYFIVRHRNGSLSERATPAFAALGGKLA